MKMERNCCNKNMSLRHESMRVMLYILSVDNPVEHSDIFITRALKIMCIKIENISATENSSYSSR